jgi:hypothetical protein
VNSVEQPSRKDTPMNESTCACGFVPTDDYHLADHLGEAFIPANDRGSDGRLHAEAARDAASVAGGTLACLCGYRAADGAALDAHLFLVFAPAGQPGLDGQPHSPTEEGAAVDPG